MALLTWYFRKERRNIGVGAVTLFGILSAHSVLETARDALFLARLPASELPWVYLAAAALTLAVITLLQRATRWLRGRSALSLTLFFGAGITLAFHFAPRTGVVAYLLYVWVAVLATVSVGQFWLLVAGRFNVTQAKRAFAVIATGGLVGAMTGSAISAPLAMVLGPEGLLVVSAALFALSGLAPLTLTSPTVPVERRAMPRPSAGQRAVLADPYARGIFAVVFLSAATLTLGDIIFKTTVATSIPKADLGFFFGVFYTVLNVLGLLVQLFLAGRIVQRFGPVAALALLPGLVAICLAPFALTLSLLPLILLKVVDGSLRHSLSRTSLEILFVPLDPSFRARVKGLCDGVGSRVGQGLASLFAAAMIALAAPPAAQALVATALAIAWSVAVRSLRKSYVELFRRQLREEVVVTTGKVRDLDQASLETLVATLNSPDDSRVTHAVDLMHSRGKTDLIPAFILYHPSATVVLHCLHLLATSGRRDFWLAAMRLAGSPDPAIRAAAINAYARSAPFLDVELLREATGDADFSARAAAFIALVKAKGVPPEEIFGNLQRLAAGSDERKASLIRAIREQGVTELDDVLPALARDAGPDVALEISRLVRQRPLPAFIPLVFPYLAIRRCRAEARTALFAIGEPAFRFLLEALADSRHATDVRRHVPRTLSRFPGKSTAPELLSQAVAEADPVVEFKILRGLGRMAAINPTIPLDVAALDRAVDRYVRRLIQLVQWRSVVDRDVESDRNAERSRRWLSQLLSGLEARSLECLFRYLGLRHPLEDFRQIYRGLSDEDERTRSGSAELVENLLREPLRDLVLTLSSRFSDDKKLKRIPKGWQPESLDLEGALRAMGGDCVESIRILAGELRRARSVPSLGRSANAE